MASYWWECSHCHTKYEFQDVSESRGIVHYIRDILIPSSWEQSHLLKECPKCNNKELRITYVFPRKKETHLQVKHMVGLESSDPNGYVPMMWETIPDRSKEETWIDFKYIEGRNIKGLNKPAVLSSRGDIPKLFQLYRNRTGNKDFPSPTALPNID